MRIRARLIVKNYELEERRKLLGYSQAEFADIVGIRGNTYQQIEQLKIKPTEEQAISMALELNVSKDVLFPQGYQKIVDIFNPHFERIADFTPPLLQSDEKRLLESMDAKIVVGKILGELNQKERKIIEVRYGIKDGDSKTYEEVGNELKLTRERVRQIEAKAFEKLRSKLKNMKYATN